jgi:hypothetical protein
MRRWFRFRLATLMLLVTLSAIGVDFLRRRSRLLEYARLHEAEADRRWRLSKLRKSDWWTSVNSRIPTDAEYAEYRERDRQQAVHHEEVTARYRRGAWFPWLVEPQEEPPRQYTLGDLLQDRPPTQRSEFAIFK